MDGEKKKFRFSIGYLILAFWVVLLVQQILGAYVQPARMSYSDFKTAVTADKVEEVAVGRSLIRGHLKQSAAPAAEPAPATRPLAPPTSAEPCCREDASRP